MRTHWNGVSWVVLIEFWPDQIPPAFWCSLIFVMWIVPPSLKISSGVPKYLVEDELSCCYVRPWLLGVVVWLARFTRWWTYECHVGRMWGHQNLLFRSSVGTWVFCSWLGVCLHDEFVSEMGWHILFCWLDSKRQILCSELMSNSWSNSQLKAPTNRDCGKMHSSMFSLGEPGYKYILGDIWDICFGVLGTW